jgi:acetate kinase
MFALTARTCLRSATGDGPRTDWSGMKVLVLNAGSSSLKFDLFDIAPDLSRPERLLGKGEIARITDMADALRQTFDRVTPLLEGEPVEAVGHRIVHGGDLFHESVIIDAEVEKGIESLCSLAPLHNPHNLEAFRAARERLPNAVHVAVFDTAFHFTLPPQAYAYGLPYEYLTEKKIRRYGFHGISHRYVSWRFA